ncbi:50S ribosomal protein L18 [Candidatus Parcubacteria bacterium]|nr:50S ribosomal protein L18 [Candidatus Parcubacteria bacterium]
MNKQKVKQNQKIRRKGRVRSKINGIKECPRLSVFKSNKGMFLQLINDTNGNTLASVSGKDIKDIKKQGKKTAVSLELGKLIAKKALDKKIDQVVFDRGGYKYHGRVKAVADGAREGGLKF